MNIDAAKLILSNLVQRYDRNPTSVFLTDFERDAITLLIESNDRSPEGSLPQEREPVARSVKETSVTNSHLDIESVRHAFVEVTNQFANVKDPEDGCLCLDFGTSLSKAFLKRGSGRNSENFEVQLGKQQEVGEQGNRLLHPSEIFAAENEIVFGYSAQRAFDVLPEGSKRAKIDSPKSFISISRDVSGLDRKLSDQKDPNQELTERKVLVLYLAHLNRRAESHISGLGLNPNYPRRYTHPAWPRDIAVENGIALKRIVGEAIVLSRAVPAQVDDKGSYNKLLVALEVASSLRDDQLPYHLLLDPVREATASGLNAYNNVEPGNRDNFVIIDIGAGTTDIAACYVVHHRETGELKIAEVTSAADAMMKAGNHLDHLLNKLLNKSIVSSEGSIEWERARTELRTRDREFKELLFTNGRLDEVLVDGSYVSIGLDEFLQTDLVKKFAEDLKVMVDNACHQVSPQGGQVKVVPTGGGANLPFIDQIIKDGVQTDSDAIYLIKADAMSSEFQRKSPELVPLFPQLAVAIGGVSDDMPEQTADMRQGIARAPKTVVTASYKS